MLLTKESIKYYYQNIIKPEKKTSLTLPGIGHHKLVLNEIASKLNYYHEGKLIYELSVFDISGNYELFD